VASPFKQFCDDVQAHVATLTKDARRSQGPYYLYGAETFDSTEGSLPAVRWRKGNGTFIADREVGGQATQGTMGSMLHDFTCRIWGKDEEQVKNEALIVFEAVKNQAPALQDWPFEWIEDDGNHSNQGAMLEFTIGVPLKAAYQVPELVLITTASLVVSSSADISGSSGSAWKTNALTA